MGESSSGSHFQKMMNQVLHQFIWKSAMVYLDDIIIFSKSLEEHLVHIKEVIDALEKAKLYLKFEKCEFGLSSIKILGHIIQAGKIKPDPEKVKAITNFPEPTSPSEVASFLGMIGYYRRFIRRFTARTYHLREARLMKKEDFHLKSEAKKEFENRLLLQQMQQPRKD
eukprot:TRINITY_DN3033_c0_g1_i3.p1 TRINITY_DN3033_c0_g1~~TRINITY_DN3033_c0_g1_i3.p1  ORF type:complete len:168 (-),score=10.72 TRINITY_DN3033_c0_g1_i3:95-598(-)